jgi:preprotein translocase subunit SecF
MNLYEKENYRLYLLVPAILAIIALLLIFKPAFMPVGGLSRGIDLRGGVTITATVGSDFDADELKSILENEFKLEDVSVRKTVNPVDNRRGVLIEFSGNSDILAAQTLAGSDEAAAKELVAPWAGAGANVTEMPAQDAISTAKENFNSEAKQFLLEYLKAEKEKLSFREVGPALSEFFWESGQRAIILAFVLMAMIVFFVFRNFVPSMAVILAAVFDLIFALACMSFFNTPLTLATIAALLMLIGYSIDTDIMLTTRVLRRKAGAIDTRLMGAVRTGLTMTGTTLAVLFILWAVTFVNQMYVMNQIAVVLLFGLVGDLASTWMMNAVLLKWWWVRKHGE